jgi:glucan-binding YG repeat protein
MSKNIRKIIIAMFVVGVFSVIEPSCLNLINTKAYAEEKPYLKNIYLSEGNDIKFSSDTNSYIVDVDQDVEEILVKPKPDNLLETVKINGKVADKDDSYREIIALEKGKNTITIEVQDEKTMNKSEYVVYVYRGGKDAVYFNDIYINGSTIGFYKGNNSYNIELDDNTSIVKLMGIVGDGQYSITVNDTLLNNTNSIKLKFKGIGKYTINIVIKDEDTERIGKYTLNIYLGIPVSPNVEGSINNVIKPNQWVMKNGRWQYNDSLGENLKNIWFYDNKYKSYFHFNSRGNMQTEWTRNDGNSYYLNLDGKMQIGWLLYEEKWYFLGLDGVMRTGWLRDGEKWYYLDENGAMETSWVFINENWYYLDSHGAMETGWIYYGKKWYYLNSNGAMETGWIKYGYDWYFLNYSGDMKCGEWLYSDDKWYYLTYAGNMRYDNINTKQRGWLNKDDKYYYFNEDGTMRTSPKTIDGYTYEFNEDGSASNV